MKIDPYNSEKVYVKWKEMASRGIPEIGEFNKNILMQYLNDMEIGVNIGVGSKKGARSFTRLISLKDRMIFIIKKIKALYNLDKISDLTEEKIHSLFNSMMNGTIKRPDGKRYKSVSDYIKIFRSFWHWYEKINRKKKIEVVDITRDLDSREEKPDWVYLTESDIKKVYDNVKYEYKVLIMFLFDSGIRAPTELMNIKVSDFHSDFKEVNIREEISKTFGRRIKLMLCPELIKQYVTNKKISLDDYLFKINPAVVNRYLKRLARKIFGEKESPAGQKYSELTMYDFRHCSCCYWMPRYKSESALKYRFGWKSSDKIHYYSELLGMRDTITEEDLLIDITKAEIEKRLEKSDNEKEILNEKVKCLESEMVIIKKWVKTLVKENLET